MKKATNSILKLLIIYLTLITMPNSHSSYPTDHAPIPKITHKIFDMIIDHDHKIHALSYNVWGLPVKLPGHHQSYRFKRLADTLISRNFEILCLQEVFNPKLRYELIDKLSDTYFMASDYTCNQPIIGKLLQKDCYGGLMTLSKYPILEETFYEFEVDEGYSIIEEIGSKGFLFSTIIWNGKLINIINTHLYAGPSPHAAKMRMQQLKEMNKILNSLQQFHENPTILFGDLNITHPKLSIEAQPIHQCSPYDFVTTTMGFEDSAFELCAESYTINPDKNRFCNKGPKKKLDYIMIRIPNSYDHELNLNK